MYPTSFLGEFETMQKNIFFGFFTVLTFLGNSYAVDEELSLSELMAIKVTVASKFEEDINTASASVTAYTDKEIEASGYYTIAQLADITPGYSSLSRNNDAGLETRGTNSFINNKHLLLIDGVSVNNARGYSAPVYNELPLLFAERIEFLRGPASALYGVSAFNGVINIIPKTVEENEQFFEAKMAVGTENFESSNDNMSIRKSFMTNYASQFQNSKISISASFYETSASLSEPATTRDNEKSYFFYGNHAVTEGLFKGLSQGIFFTNRTNGFGEGWQSSDPNHVIQAQAINQHSWESIIAYARYQKALTDRLHLNAYLKYNQSTELGLQGNTEGWWAPAGQLGAFFYQANPKSWEFQAETKYDYHENGNIIIGLNFERRKMDNSSFSADISGNHLVDSSYIYFYNEPDHLVAPYIQARHEFDLLSGLITTAGLRWDNGFTEARPDYHVISPRLAMTQRFTEQINFKASWANALKAPGLTEIAHNLEKSQAVAVNFDTTFTAPGLDAETIQTFEAGMNFNNKKIYLSYTHFYNITESQLDRINPEIYLLQTDPNYVAGSRLQYAYDFWFNKPGKIEAQGLEIESKYRFSNSWNAFANYSFAETWNDEGQSFRLVPSAKLNFGTNYIIHRLSLFAIGKWVQGYRSTQGTSRNPHFFFLPEDSNLASSAGATSNGHLTFDFNAKYKITQFTELGMKVLNLTDEKYLLPNNAIYFEMYRPGREIFIEFSTKF